MTKRTSKPFGDPKQNGDVDEMHDRFLILHNDEVHSFDYVIEALVDVCDHQQEQAEQCALITHFKGKCDVKKGSMSALRSKRSELSHRGLIATID